MTTLSAFVMVVMFGTAFWTRSVMRRPWHAGARGLGICLGAFSLPVAAWWFAFNSLGSGWGFGLIAIFVTIGALLGLSVGILWAFCSRIA